MPILTDPTGKKTVVSQEMADSYSAGANSLAPGYSINKIDATNLNATPYATPPVVPKTGYAGLMESTNAVITKTDPLVEQGAKDVQSVYDKLGQQASARASEYESAGVYDKQKTYNDITNRMSAGDLAYRRKVEKIKNENPTGQLSEGQQIAADKAESEWASTRADLAISAAFAKDDYTLAKQIVDDKINAQTEDLMLQLDGLKFFYDKNSATLSDARKNALDFQIKQVENELADKKALLSDVANVQLEAAKNGAPVDVQLAIGKSASVQDAIAAGGQYIGLYDRLSADSIMDERANNDGGSYGFTKTQFASGAATAGMSLDAFKGLDADAQNFFINGDLSGAQKSIDDAFLNEGATLEEAQAAIKEMGLPAEGEAHLLKYAQQSYSKNAYTTEDFKADAISDLQAQKQQGKNRADAYNAVRDAFLKDAPLSPEETAALNEAIDQVYGKRTWLSKILPGGN